MDHLYFIVDTHFLMRVNLDLPLRVFTSDYIQMVNSGRFVYQTAGVNCFQIEKQFGIRSQGFKCGNLELTPILLWFPVINVD